MNPIPLPSPPSTLLSFTCSLSNPKISLSAHLAGTGLYAGLKFPTVCAHSPLGGSRLTTSSLLAGSVAEAGERATLGLVLDWGEEEGSSWVAQ